MNSASDTKQKLIDTALELIWRNSYGSVSVDDICKAADVKKGSFYHFFPSKVDLAVAAMEESSKAMKPELDRIFSPANPPLERFRLLAEHMYDKQVEALEKFGHVCGCPCAALGSEMANQETAIRAKFDETVRRQERYFENAIRDLIATGQLTDSVDPAVKAQEIYTYLMGQMMVARIQNNLGPMKRDLMEGFSCILGLPEGQSPEAAA